MPSFVLPATRIVLTAANAAPRRFEERLGWVEYQLHTARLSSCQGCTVVRHAPKHVVRAVSGRARWLVRVGASRQLCRVAGLVRGAAARRHSGRWVAQQARW